MDHHHSDLFYLPRVGQSVKTGQIVGKVGFIGRSTGPHLHYETRVKGDSVDPQKFLRGGARLDGSI
jgi:murein DD-endopeptidase MepM/ murein hydrolase activator NlpD